MVGSENLTYTTATSYSGGANFVNGSTATTEYAYDANGNLTKNSAKGISNIAYNCLNLDKIGFASS